MGLAVHHLDLRDSAPAEHADRPHATAAPRATWPIAGAVAGVASLVAAMAGASEGVPR